MTNTSTPERFVPTRKQRLALAYDVDELLFGGSMGGGKSEVLIAAGLRLCKTVPGSTALLMRRTYPELHELKRRIQARAPEARFVKSSNTFYFPNKAELQLGHAQYDDDVTKYQGRELQLLLIDELTHFTKFQYTFLLSRLRASGTVLARMNELGIRPSAMSSANPTGHGHAWVKERFITPAPPQTMFRTQAGSVRVYVPARLTDNPHLDQSQYLKQLRGLDPVMQRAMIDGDWDVLLGSVRFPNWRRHLHVVNPEEYPIDVTKHRTAVGVDYGVADPYAAVWGALMPDGTVVVYRETGGTDKTATEQARQIKHLEQPEERTHHHPTTVAADRSMWNRTGRSGAKQHDTTRPDPGSIAHAYYQQFGNQLTRSNSDRIAGWARIDELLRPRPCDTSCGQPNCEGHPRLIIYSTCVNTIKDLAELPRAKRNPEDAETSNVNDHYPDALRYLVMELTTTTQHARSTTAGTKPVTRGIRTKGF